MTKILRRLMISLIIILAMAGAGLSWLSHSQHLGFYSVQRPNSDQTLKRGDLIVFKNAITLKPTQIATIPKLGYGLGALQNPIGLTTLVYLPAFLIILFEVKRLSRHYAYKPYDLGEVVHSQEYNRSIN